MTNKDQAKATEAPQGAGSELPPVDHGLTQPGQELPLSDLYDKLDDDCMELFEGAGRMFTRMTEEFTAGTLSWQALATSINGVCEQISEDYDGDIYIRQFNDEQAAEACIRVLVDDQYLVSSIRVSHASIMKAPVDAVPEGGEDEDDE